MGFVRLLALCGVLAAVRCAGGQAITIGALFVCPDEPANAADCRSDAGFNNMAAVRVAVADANADASILPGRTLQIEDVPITALRAMTYGREAEGQDIASDLQAAGAVAAVGAGFSSDSFVLAPALAVHDIPLISHSATNEDLSNTTAFPLFARAVQPDNLQSVRLCRVSEAVETEQQLPLMRCCCRQMFLADAVGHFVTQTGSRRVAMAVCADVYCEGLAEGVKKHLAAKGIAPLFEEEIPDALVAADGPVYLSRLKAGFDEHREANCDNDPDLGPPIVVLCAHSSAHHLLEAETTHNFQAVWIGGDGVGNSFIGWDLAALDAQNAALFAVRPVDPAVTDKQSHLASHVTSQSQYVPLA